MFLIDDIKPNSEKEFKTCLIFYGIVLGGESALKNKTSFVSSRGMFAGSNNKKTLFKRIEKKIPFSYNFSYN